MFLSTFMSCVCRWWPPWAGRGTPNTSCALTARRRSAPETSLSATASRTASRTTTTCSLHAATTATGPFWTCVPVALCVLPPAVSCSEDPATVTAVCVCVFRKWWRPWIGRGIPSTSSVLSVDLFLDQKVTMSSHWQLLMCVNIPDVVKSSGPKPEWMNSMTRSNNAGLNLSSVWVYISMLVLARKYFICSSFMWIEGFCLWSCEGFHEKDGKAYCRKDYFDMFAPKCGGCARAILENYISALSSLWHPECFVCRVSNQISEQPSAEGRIPALRSAAGSGPRWQRWRCVSDPQECFTPFVNGSFFEHDGQPYCEIHYHERRGSLCSGCQKPITGRCITAMAKKFHPEHFVCAFCLKQLNKGTFKEQNEKPYCHGCFIKLFS